MTDYTRGEVNAAAPKPLTKENYPYGLQIKLKTELGESRWITLNAETASPILQELRNYRETLPDPDAENIPVCRKCYSAQIKVDAFAEWDASAGGWELSNSFEETAVCEGHCGGEVTSLKWMKPAQAKEARRLADTPEDGDED